MTGRHSSLSPPDRLVDVLIWRADDDLGEPIGWDIGYYGNDQQWHSAMQLGDVIPAPLCWYDLPESPDAREP